MSFSFLQCKTTCGPTLAAIVLHFTLLAAFGPAAPSSASPGPKAAKLAPVSEATPRLVIDMQRQVIDVRLTDIVLREYAFTILDDGGMTGGFTENLSSPPSEMPIVESVYLISGAETIPEAELRIIAEETGLGADHIQRFLPGKMVLVTSEGMRIYIETECPTAKTFRWQWIKDVFGRVWCALTGGNSLHLSLSAEDAMSLYGVARSRPPVTVKQ